ncbi:MAG: UDP-3-O-(3-hydroxymyristoyl)glucosamine N-acyltransferase [Sphingobacteriaceae bacterium]|nr:UDP-3-O-(3-hydroxymyristoyl)glucosamine N-acyltransferase [Sphingobacteriaceae bacterium]
MQFTVTQISEFLNGTIEGDLNVTVNALSKIEEGVEGSICFLSNPKYENYLYTTKASIVIVSESLILSDKTQATLIRVKDPYNAFTQLLQLYHAHVAQSNEKKGIEQPSFIHPSAKIGNNVYIAAFSYIDENVTIGDNCKIHTQTYIGAQASLANDCTIYSGVKIYHNSQIGNRVTIHSNTVIGSDGFGFAPNKDGSYTKIPQIGNVIIEDDVEIGANSTIDRATMGSTFIRKGAKLDNLIQIAHNVEVGENTVIAAQSGVAGSTKVGSNVILGGQVGVSGHITVAKGSQVGAQAGINSSITAENLKWHGSPAQPLSSWMKSSVILRKLPTLNNQITLLENKIKALEEALKKTIK